MVNNWNELKYILRSDCYRYNGKVNLKLLCETLWVSPELRYTLLMRLCSYLIQHRSNVVGKIISRFFLELLRHFQIRYGIGISPYTKIGSGFYISHYGGIMVNTDVIIGRNCNIGHNVTIGQSNRGERQGCPVIGDNVFIGPGAVILGKIRVGNNVAIGANSVVVKDAPDDAVVAGNPARVISYKGSTGYINKIDY